MLQHKIIRLIHLHGQWVLVIILSVFTSFLPGVAGAADLTSRQIVIGTSRPNTVTAHSFRFNVVSTGTLGSIEFEYCSNSPIVGSPCVAPPGLDVSGANIVLQQGETGFSVHPASTASRLILTRVPSASSPQASRYDLGNIMNPSDQQQSAFVRISTFASTNASGPRADQGAVVFSTARDLTVTGYVPPFLTFCTGITVAMDCSTTDGDFINFGELLRTLPSSATSQFAGATNDPAGYNVSVHGNTMTSGNNVIPALAVNGGSITGTSQYGLNLRQNNAPTVGQDPAGPGTALITSSYGVQNSFRYVSSDILVDSTLPTEFNRFTVSYLVNVSPAQDPGIYATTMTYVAVAAF